MAQKDDGQHDHAYAHVPPVSGAEVEAYASTRILTIPGAFRLLEAIVALNPRNVEPPVLVLADARVSTDKAIAGIAQFVVDFINTVAKKDPHLIVKAAERVIAEGKTSAEKDIDSLKHVREWAGEGPAGGDEMCICATTSSGQVVC